MERDLDPNARHRIDWIGGLDGLRAVAVLLVVAFHLQTRQWFPGGFIGVDLFFVLSGFLITKILLAEHQRSDGIDLVAFYLRRARRLLPALVLTLLLVSFVSLVVMDPSSPSHPSWALYARSLIAALGYGFNWLIATSTPYMHSLVHVWSLSIEEQFYILWPAAFAWMLRRRFSREQMQAVLVVLIGLSISVQFWFLDWGWQRLYYGSDYRAHALLAGCLLAILHSDDAIRQRMARARWRRPMTVAAVAALGVIAATVRLDTAEMYMGGFIVVVFSSVVLIHWTIASRPDSATRRLLDSPPLVWLGKRSYGIYLFHMPFVVWTREFDFSMIDQMVFVCGATLLLADYAYRFIERPLVDGTSPLMRGRAWIVARRGVAA